MPGFARRSGTSESVTDIQALSLLLRRAPAATAPAIAAALFAVAAIPANFASQLSALEALGASVFGLALATCAALGALILAGTPRHGLGRALLIGGVLASSWALATPLAEDMPQISSTLLAWSAWVANWTFAGLMILVTWPLLLFPDGRLPSRRWHWRCIASLLALGIFAIGLSAMFDPGTLETVESATPVSNPLGIPGSWTWIEALGVFGFGFPIGVIAALIAVDRRSGAAREPGVRVARWATRALGANFALWLVLAAAGVPIDDSPLFTLTFVGSITVFAMAAALVVLHRRVVEVDLLLRRAFISVGVSAVAVVLFVVVFAAIAAVAGDGAATLGGGIAVALIAVPLRTRVRDRVDAALYGHRDAGASLAHVSEALEGARDPADALPALARAVADAVNAGSVLIEPDPQLGLAPFRLGPRDDPPVVERELRHRTVHRGRLVLGGRTPGEAYSAGDLQLIELVARQVALALDAVALAVQLRQSRSEIVTAREEERRRLRRDLHDRLGPALAGIALTLEAAQHHGGDGESGALVDEAREQAQLIVADVRRIVHGLRPPILDELGLAAAVRAHADRFAPLVVDIDLPEHDPALSAAAEMTLYCIAIEALTNVVRHAGAQRCDIVLRVAADDIVLEISDDGCGLDRNATAGIGLQSMHERAAQLDGRVAFEQPPDGGTRIVVRLPRMLAAPESCAS